jgi:peroxiredoxin
LPDPFLGGFMTNPQVTQTTPTTPSPLHTLTGAVQAGSRLPDFTLKLATKDGQSEFNLASHLQKGPIVFAFFPIAFSGVCTKEMCDMRDNLAQFQGKGAQVFGFSTDSQHANVEFAKAHDMGQGIISDPNREVIPRIWQTATVAGIHNVAKRGIMVVAPDGTVKWTSVSDDPKVWVGAQEVAKHI